MKKQLLAEQKQYSKLNKQLDDLENRILNDELPMSISREEKLLLYKAIDIISGLNSDCMVRLESSIDDLEDGE